MMEFPQFSCPVHKIDDIDYYLYRYQYATTSQPQASMTPAAIIYPQYPNADPDIEKAIQYAAANGLGVAVRTGGHAYSGTSSTNSNNIQIDMSDAYTEWSYDTQTGLLRMGVSHSLLEFNTKLKDAGLFMPTGQCYNVHVGGHAQTGGYGQLSRAFGLFSDQIVSFEIFLADGIKRTISVDSTDPSDKALFFAVLGGGPGNYGIVTHITLRPLKDSNHQYSRALKRVIPYDPKLDHDVLVQLFNLTKEWENAPGDYDFSITVAAAQKDFILNHLGIASVDDFMVTFFGGKTGSSPFNVLIVYFQYSNLDNKPDTYDPSWCQKVKDILKNANQGESFWEWVEQQIINNTTILCDDTVITPISQSVTQLWTYGGTREFNYPFLKNGQVTDTVASSEWAEWAATRIDQMTGRSADGLMVFMQCENFGGPNSAVVKNGARHQTSYAWRNTTIGYNLDVFYDDAVTGAQGLAADWQNVNTAEGIGANGMFSTADHRWFWATHGNLNMNEIWPCYYSDADYTTCCAVKQAVDPKGVFTPNTFVVGYTPANAPEHLTSAQAGLAKPQGELDDVEGAKRQAARARQHAEAKGIDLALTPASHSTA